ncbi:hypothetical protein H6F77_26965 [Microcoleus sp. FACHB-831]|uniref:CIS tube protein n=1 Tax=Microcoleus sp. FACHB-831 TaxID=2692827 RepID=UPI0016885DC8|nr:hypothetical protein [Microcoleus sp. FACHB-831]MBD1924673.1 hypothetical protein [Microcoleus sp. FACHB-831]
MRLEKAYLSALDSGGEDIHFMFNPTELTFTGSVKYNDNQGAQAEKTGKSKVSFSNVNPSTVTISNILFDTYEDGIDVFQAHIKKFRDAIIFVPGLKRTPMYGFFWGEHPYMPRCVVENLTYKLTMFLADGTPVRAVIDSLTLKEADEPESTQSLSTPEVSKPQRLKTQPRKNKAAKSRK